MDKINIFIEKYTKKFAELILLDKKTKKKLIHTCKLIQKTKIKKNKIIIAGNGGSAAIASHFSVDLTKNAKVRCVNFNESDLITCFSNDYGYENWVKQSLKFYTDKGDLIILISSSGNSKNIINAAKFAKNKKHQIVTFTGFSGKNKLSKLGNTNFIVKSNNFNLIENVHQFWLLLIVDILSLK